MADITNKAEEFAGRAKEAAGDLVGNDDLKAEGAADKATAQVKQGLDAVADKAEDAAQAVTEKAEDAKEAVTEKAQDAKQAVAEKTDEVKQVVAEKADSRVAIAVVAGSGCRRPPGGPPQSWKGTSAEAPGRQEGRGGGRDQGPDALSSPARLLRPKPLPREPRSGQAPRPAAPRPPGRTPCGVLADRRR